MENCVAFGFPLTFEIRFSAAGIEGVTLSAGTSESRCSKSSESWAGKLQIGYIGCVIDSPAGFLMRMVYHRLHKSPTRLTPSKVAPPRPRRRIDFFVKSFEPLPISSFRFYNVSARRSSYSLSHLLQPHPLPHRLLSIPRSVSHAQQETALIDFLASGYGLLGAFFVLLHA